jgi:uncharacterized protein
MRINFEMPWEKYALIAELSSRFAEIGVTLGKTALQKMVFLLQRVYKVDCDYSYNLYTYGPFCADVARDLDVVEGLGGVDVSFDSWGYAIRPGQGNEDLRRRGAEFLANISPMLNSLVQNFGRYTARELELRSTIVYLSESERAKPELVALVRQVKPHFSATEIARAVEELEGGRFIDRLSA